MPRKPDPAICLHTRRVVRWQADGTPLTVCEHCGAVLLEDHAATLTEHDA